MSEISSNKGEVIFVAIQPDKDTMELPTSAGTVFITGQPDFKQPPVTDENTELTDGYAEQPPEFVGFNVGDLKITCNLKVSGAPGTTSNLHPLFLSLCGRHTVTPGVQVEYLHHRKGDPLTYLTIIYKKQHIVYFITGAVVTTGELKLEPKKIQKIDFNGYFLTKVYAGQSNLKNAIDGTTTAVTALELDGAEDYQRYKVGARINVGTDDNSGAGFLITAIDKATNKLTVEPGVGTAQAAGSLIQGWTPVAVKTGENLVSRHGWISTTTGELGARDVRITGATYKLENGLKKFEDESSWEDFTGGYSQDTRKVSLDITNYARTQDYNTQYLIENMVDMPCTLNIGKEAGRSLQIVMPAVRMVEANENGSPELKFDKKHRCYESIGDDESKWILK